MSLADETTALIASKHETNKTNETDDGSSSSSDEEEEVGGKRMSLMSLVFLSYFCVCGGPYGLEVAVNAGYPALTFIGLAVIPWVFKQSFFYIILDLGITFGDDDCRVEYRNARQ